MEPKKSMHIHARGKSFTYAFNGLWLLFKEEPNAKLHALATVAVIIAGFVRHLGPSQWIALVVAIGLVWITEAINTCIERLCDFCSDNKWHPAIKIIKDIAAAAVMVAAVVSIVIGIIVFFF